MEAYRTGPGQREDAGPSHHRGEHRARRRRWRSSSPSCPYQASCKAIAARIQELVDAGDLEGIADVNDNSAGGKTNLVIRLKRDANANVVLNNLFKQTQLQTSFPVNMVALVDGVPRTLNLGQALQGYIATTRSRSSPAGRSTASTRPAGTSRDPGRPAPGPQRDRRGHRPHPGQRGSGRGPRRPHGALRVHRAPVRAHPRDAPRPARPASPASTSSSASRSCASRSPSSRPSSATTLASARSSRRPAGASRSSSPRPVAAEITLDAGDMSDRGPGRRQGAGRRHDRGRLREDGRRRRVQDPGPRWPRRGRGQAQERRPRQPRHLHDGPRLPALLLQPGQGVPAAGHGDPRARPHGQGHPHRQPAAAGVRRDHPRHHRHPHASPGSATSSSPPRRARSRRPEFHEYDSVAGGTASSP